MLGNVRAAMQDNPLVLALLIGAGLYVSKLFWDDLRAARRGTPNPNPLPGAVPTRPVAVWIAVAGALVLLTIETIGENALGISAEQSDMTALFAAYTLLAAVIEEIIFRGFIVVTGRGPGVQWAAAFGASIVFALLHPFLWSTEGDAGFHLTLTTKGWWSFAVVFVSSLWFYAARFLPVNPTHSLLPCIAAHAAKNLGVIVVKGVQGHLVGWW